MQKLLLLLLFFSFSAVVLAKDLPRARLTPAPEKLAHFDLKIASLHEEMKSLDCKGIIPGTEKAITVVRRPVN